MLYIKVLKYNVIHLVALQWETNQKKASHRKKNTRVNFKIALDVKICGLKKMLGRRRGAIFRVCPDFAATHT